MVRLAALRSSSHLSQLFWEVEDLSGWMSLAYLRGDVRTVRGERAFML